MSSNDERRDRIHRAWDAAWGRGEVEALDELLSPDYRRFGSSGEGQDATELKESIRSTREAFPDLVTTIDEVIVEGDRAAIRWHSSGKHEHSFLDVPATKRTVSVNGATFAQFDGDRIVAEHVTWDPRALLTALGIITVGQDT